MKKLISLLIKLSNILNYIAIKLQEMNLKEEFYVYVPSANKPKYKHNTFLSAKKEAERIADKLTMSQEIEVLQVVYKTTGKELPF